MTTETTNAQASGTFSIGGDLNEYRLGFGAMRITGPGIWVHRSRSRSGRAVSVGPWPSA